MPHVRGGVSIVRIMSLFSCRHCQEINKPFVSETSESACILYLHLYVYSCHWDHHNIQKKKKKKNEWNKKAGKLVKYFRPTILFSAENFK